MINALPFCVTCKDTCRNYSVKDPLLTSRFAMNFLLVHNVSCTQMCIYGYQLQISHEDWAYSRRISF